MSSTNPLPEPTIDLQRVETLPLDPDVTPIPLPDQAAVGPTFVNRVLAVLAIVDRVVEYLVEAAEGLAAAGDEKRAWVRKEARGWIRYLEGRFNLLPRVVEGVVLRISDLLLDLAIDRAFRRLEKAGIVNAHK